MTRAKRKITIRCWFRRKHTVMNFVAVDWIRLEAYVPGP
jgi:hypothetical protein